MPAIAHKAPHSPKIRQAFASTVCDDPGVSNHPTNKRKRLSFAAILIVIVVGAFMGIEEFVLCGDLVVSDRLSSTSPASMTLSIHKNIGQKHAVKLRSRRKRRSRREKGSEFGIKVLGPNGEVLYEVDEHVRHKTHYFTFTPTVAGDHTLILERQDVMGSRVMVNCEIEIFINDRRILMPLLYSLGV